MRFGDLTGRRPSECSTCEQRWGRRQPGSGYNVANPWKFEPLGGKTFSTNLDSVAGGLKINNRKINKRKENKEQFLAL